MTLTNQILILSFSLTGFLFGLILSIISPEELKPGKKYFVLIKRTLFLALFFTINFFFYQSNQYLYLIVFTILALLLFITKLRYKTIYLEIPAYLIFITAYLITSSPFHLVLPSLLFLYGLPAGTLFRTK